MARYYEEETLFQSAKDELLKYFSDSFVYTSAELFHKVLANTPTADVAPKSEVALDVIRKVKNKVRKYKQNAVNPYEHIMLYLNELEKKYTKEK